MFALIHDRPQRPTPRQGQHRQLLGEMREPQLHPGRPRREHLPRDGLVAQAGMEGFKVDPRVRRRARRAEPVDRDPGADLLVRPGVTVRPVVQLLVDPGQQGDGAVGEGVADRLRLRALLVAVAAALLVEPFGAREAGLLGVGVGCEGVLEGLPRVLRELGLPGRHHVEVRAFAVLRVEDAN